MRVGEKEGTYKDIVRWLINTSCKIILMKTRLFKDITSADGSVCISLCFCVSLTTSQQRVHNLNNVQMLEVNLVLLIFKNACRFCQLAYATSTDALDDNLRMSGCTARQSHHKICNYVMRLYGSRYLHKLTCSDV